MTGRRKAIQNFLIVLALATLAIQVYARYVPYSLTWVVTPSIPQGLYVSKAVNGRLLERDEIACFDYPAPAWAQGRGYVPEGMRLCKFVAGVPGDFFSREGDTLLRAPNGAHPAPIAQFVHVDSKKRPLPQDAPVLGEVPSGEYVMLAPKYPNSLDSRYYGRVQARTVTKTLKPIITW